MAKNKTFLALLTRIREKCYNDCRKGGLKMATIFTRNDLLAHGKEENGRICIEKGFVLSCPAPITEQIAILDADTLCEGAPAKIFFRLLQPGRGKPLYQSHTYTLGGQRRLALPPVLWESITLEVCVNIPKGSTLFVKEFELSHAGKTSKTDTVLRYNAHLGFLGMAPENTMISFRLAALCGFQACICVPKVTKDGVLICTHDTTINHAARYKDGRELERDIYVQDLSYKELLTYDFGIRKGDVFAGTRVARLEDFFTLCQKTGMRPMFSTHPSLPREKWLEVKKALERYELLPHFHIKAPDANTLREAWEIFGAQIDGYTLDVQRMEADTIPSLLATGIDSTRSRVGIEVRLSNLQDADVARIRAAGMFAAVWALPRCDFDTVYGRLIALGVTEFTEDHHIPI